MLGEISGLSRCLHYQTIKRKKTQTTKEQSQENKAKQTPEDSVGSMCSNIMLSLFFSFARSNWASLFH